MLPYQGRHGEGKAVQRIIGLGTQIDPEALKLETRKRRWIKNVVRLEIHPDVMKHRIRVLQNAFEYLHLISASAIYNCYGLVFASRRTAIVGEEDVEAILEDDGYRKLPWDPAAWMVGDIAIYRDPTTAELKHVGMIAEKILEIESTRINIKVLSAWGENGEFLHPIDRVHPLFGTLAEIRSQRFLLS